MLCLIRRKEKSVGNNSRLILAALRQRPWRGEAAHAESHRSRRFAGMCMFRKRERCAFAGFCPWVRRRRARAARRGGPSLSGRCTARLKGISTRASLSLSLSFVVEEGVRRFASGKRVCCNHMDGNTGRATSVCVEISLRVGTERIR